MAKRLDWKLLDSAPIGEIANLARVDPQLAREFDERVDSWLYRIGRRALWHGGFDTVAVLPETAVFDSETMARPAREAIERAWETGNCVIAGRGAGSPTADAAGWVRAVDAERARYVQMNFGRNWRDPHLYDPTIDSKLGNELVVSAIPTGMGNPS